MARFSGDIGRMKDPNLIVSPVQKADMSPLFDLAKGIYRGKVEADLETEVEGAVGEFISSNKAPAEATQQLQKRAAEGSQQMNMLIDQTLDDDPALSFEAEDDFGARSETAQAFEKEITMLKAAAEQGGMSTQELQLRVERATRGAIDRLPGLAPQFRQLASARFGDFDAEIAPYVQAQKFQTARAEQLAKAETEDMIAADRVGMSLPAYRAYRATKAQKDMAKELAKDDADRFGPALLNSYEAEYQVAANTAVQQFADETGAIDPRGLFNMRQSFESVYQKQRVEITQTARERGWDTATTQTMLNNAKTQRDQQMEMLASADKAKLMADTLKLVKDSGQMMLWQKVPQLMNVVETFGAQGAGNVFKHLETVASYNTTINDPAASTKAKTYAQNKLNALYENYPELESLHAMGLMQDPQQAAAVNDYYAKQFMDSYRAGTPTKKYPGFLGHDVITKEPPSGDPKRDGNITKIHIKYSWTDKAALGTFLQPNAISKVLADPEASANLRDRVTGEITSIAREMRDYVNADLSLGFAGRQSISPGAREQLRALRINESMKKFDQVKRFIHTYGPAWYGHQDSEKVINDILIREGVITDKPGERSQAQQDQDDIRRAMQQARQPMAGVTAVPAVEEPTAEPQPEPVGVVNPITGMGRPISSQESIDALPPGLRSQMMPREQQPEAVVEDPNAEFPVEDMEMQEEIPQSTIDLLHEREGFRQAVYPDSVKTKEHPQGQPTVGFGHLIRPNKMYTLEDGTTKKGSELKFGDVLDRQELDKLFLANVTEAYTAANEQAAEAGISDPEFLDVLTSVNFQLGTNWTKKFFNSWPAIKSGNYDKAIEGIKNSKWAKQTPKRVDDFVRVLEKLKANKTSAATPQRLEPGTYLIDGELVEIS